MRERRGGPDNGDGVGRDIPLHLTWVHSAGLSDRNLHQANAVVVACFVKRRVGGDWCNNDRAGDVPLLLCEVAVGLHRHSNRLRTAAGTHPTCNGSAIPNKHLDHHDDDRVGLGEIKTGKNRCQKVTINAELLDDSTQRGRSRDSLETSQIKTSLISFTLTVDSDLLFWESNV